MVEIWIKNWQKFVKNAQNSSDIMKKCWKIDLTREKNRWKSSKVEYVKIRGRGEKKKWETSEQFFTNTIYRIILGYII